MPNRQRSKFGRLLVERAAKAMRLGYHSSDLPMTVFLTALAIRGKEMFKINSTVRCLLTIEWE